MQALPAHSRFVNGGRSALAGLVKSLELAALHQEANPEALSMSRQSLRRRLVVHLDLVPDRSL